MKYFTEPNGLFMIKIPVEWQYANVAARYEEVSPFSFQLYEGNVGAFQISCYSTDQKPLNYKGPVQKADKQNLKFIKSNLPDKDFVIHLWFAVVEDHTFMAKYIHDINRSNDSKVKAELRKAEKALSTLVFISIGKRKNVIDNNRYDNFMASLAASFDLKAKALLKKSYIELLIITASQIDAYLRMSIVLKMQLEQKTNNIESKYLYQGKDDIPITERVIYKVSKEMGIIDNNVFDKLEYLYKQRNKIVHRYIISDFKTRELSIVFADYDNVCELVRIKLELIEKEQEEQKIGIYGKRNPYEVPNKDDLKLIHSQVNDKHLIKRLNRKISF